MFHSTLRTHLSLFTSSMTHFSPLPAQQQTVSTLVMYVSVQFMYTFISHMSSMTFSSLLTQQQAVSTLVLFMCPSTLCTYFVSLYILHDTFFTTTCTTTECKYSCSVHMSTLCTYFYILHDTLLTTTCTSTVSKYFSFYASVH